MTTKSLRKETMDALKSAADWDAVVEAVEKIAADDANNARAQSEFGWTLESVTSLAAANIRTRALRRAAEETDTDADDVCEVYCKALVEDLHGGEERAKRRAELE